MRDKKASAWVVYMMPVKGHPEGMRAVCEQGEWDAMERDRPGYYTLIQANLTNEGEAEKLARGTSGAARTHNAKRQPASWPGETATKPATAEKPATDGPL